MDRMVRQTDRNTYQYKYLDRLGRQTVTLYLYQTLEMLAYTDGGTGRQKDRETEIQKYRKTERHKYR